ncbi:class I adenylate-forming enzyme family protein [Marinobacter sp. TBZ242]|uniref:Class I adenylate-forming enzyme family protein n=1 Tax=Marinobacter azerbaijanicus TaxID=3050455 RepID=A0ABT7IE58_9GAMM|nr:class I adenylate-forming enzyme family protein [Marinobacter sp. TBZ242]MDL0431953.1 class I adenylate-forming enzyme family protein [Marinobacter sp. TBZ242]
MQMPVHAPVDPEETMETIGDRIQDLAAARPHQTALIDDQGSVSWRELVSLANRIANRLRAEGLREGDTVALLSENRIEAVAVYLATLVAGGCVVPLSGMASGDSLALMVNDCAARFLFVSKKNLPLLDTMTGKLNQLTAAGCISLDTDDDRLSGLNQWLGQTDSEAKPAKVTLDHPFNIIYSSGTTGTPKGILHDYRFRQRQMVRMSRFGLDGNAVNLVSTPLYSNTTLVSVLPTLFNGGTLILMARFDARRFLELAEHHRVTHAMLVPVQYQRILADPGFDRFDLSSFQLKLCTSAPLRADVIREAMARWPGNIREVYGLTEGGISTCLDCAAHPDKWESVGMPTEGAEVRVIDEQGNELPRGETGEIVGRAISMMRGYVNRDDQTREMLWTSPEGQVFYRSGDMGRVDEDGFVYILDRRKDMIISGGFNIYATDLEQVLLSHPAVADAAVIGIPSEQWGETPLGLVVLAPGAKGREQSEAELLAWANSNLGKTQRLAAIEVRRELPRSSIGKVLKRELRAPYWP